MKNNIKILVCCHKQSRLPSNSLFLPIQVGKASSEVDLGIIGDNEGNNMSEKNSSYCELTGMYWAWKNLKNIDVIGLCHYRRYFDFKGVCPILSPCIQLPTNKFSDRIIEPDLTFLEQLKDGTLIVPRKTYYKLPVYANYCTNHISDDFKLLCRIFENEPEKYKRSFFRLMYNSNAVTHYNMFLMRWGDFDKYCSWLFDILAKVESQTDISHYNSVQKRIYGYMAERLMSVYIDANNLTTIRKPVIWFSDDNIVGKISFLKRLYRMIIYKFATYLVRDRNLKK